MSTQTKAETKKERRVRELNEHYAKCEALARKLGHEKPNGRRISVGLLKLERKANEAATAQCNGEAYGHQPYRNEAAWERFTDSIEFDVGELLGAIPPGFFVNGDARGYALKIDNEDTQGKALIDDLRLHTDWGGYGILSPDLRG